MMPDADMPQGESYLDETYLGDGLYVSFDGFNIVLRAPRLGGDHFVAMEPQVYQAFMLWLKRRPLMKAHLEGALR